MTKMPSFFAEVVKKNPKSIFKADEIPPYDVISTGSLSLDEATGIGGVPNNCAIQIAGEPGSGKTTLALQIVRNALTQYPESYALWIDIEGRMDAGWLKAHIPDPEMRDRIIVIFPLNVEESIDWFEDITEKADGSISVVVYDSIGGAATKSEQEKSAEIGNFGGNAKAVARLSRSLGPRVNKWQILFIGINQVRHDLANKYNEWTFPGGKAWEHVQTLNIFLRASKAKDGKVFEKIKGVEKQVGTLVSALIMKNSVGAPNMKAEYWFYFTPCSFGFGIDTIEEAIRLSTVLGVIEQRGAWFYHPALVDGKAQGKTKLVEMIREDPALLATIVSETKAALVTGEDLSEVISSFDPEDLDDNSTSSWMQESYSGS